MSLDNAFSARGARGAGHARIQRDGVDDAEYLCELKVDGLAINLLYEDGRLVRGADPRRRRTGEDVTPNVRTIANIPHRLTARDEFPSPELRRGPRRGLLPGRRRSRSSTPSLVDAGKAPFANPRNSAAGLAAAEGPAGHRHPRRWRMVCHGIGAGEGFEPDAAVGGVRRARGLGAAGQRPGQGRAGPGGGDGVHRLLRRAPPRRRARDRRRRRQGRPGRRCSAGSARRRARRAGRSRSSTRPRRSTPSSSTSGSTSAAPAGSRRSAAWSRCWSPARPSRWRRCTTPREVKRKGVLHRRHRGPAQGRRRDPRDRRPGRSTCGPTGSSASS